MLSTATSTKALPISIHALRKESDYSVIVHKVDTIHFYPRSPHGERPQLDMDSVVALLFLSTLSVRRATVSVFGMMRLTLFLSTLSVRRATSQRSR